MAGRAGDTRREIAAEKAPFLREFYEAVRQENEDLFRLLLKAWQIEPGSIEEQLALDAFHEEIASRKVRRLETTKRRRP